MRAVLALMIGLYTAAAGADGDAWLSGREELQGIDDQVQNLKKEVIQINQELSLLEEKLLFPSTTQVSVFVSLDARPDFRLDSLELSLDDQVVAKYVYTFRELEALHNGGVQRLHTGNIATGKHRLTARVRGQTAGGTAFEQSDSVEVSKDVNPKFVEMQITASGGQPRIRFRDW